MLPIFGPPCMKLINGTRQKITVKELKKQNTDCNSDFISATDTRTE